MSPIDANSPTSTALLSADITSWCIPVGQPVLPIPADASFRSTAPETVLARHTRILTLSWHGRNVRVYGVGGRSMDLTPGPSAPGWHACNCNARCGNGYCWFRGSPVATFDPQSNLATVSWTFYNESHDLARSVYLVAAITEDGFGMPPTPLSTSGPDLNQVCTTQECSGKSKPKMSRRTTKK